MDRVNSEDVRNSYLKAVGKSEFDTDFTALRKSDIDALLRKRTGYGLSDMTNPLSWTYLKEEKVYCMKTDDGMYYILYENPCLKYTYENTTCMVTLKKQGDTYQFVANVKDSDEF